MLLRQTSHSSRTMALPGSVLSPFSSCLHQRATASPVSSSVSAFRTSSSASDPSCQRRLTSCLRDNLQWDRRRSAAGLRAAPWKSLKQKLHNSSIARTGSAGFTYRVSVAYSAKGDNLDPANNFLNLDASPSSSSASSQKFETDDERSPSPPLQKRPRSGQDAFFARNIEEAGGVALGVADGVGGYQDIGIDAAEFSHALCEHMGHFAGSPSSQVQGSPPKPSTLMNHAFREVIRDPSVYGGGSTACVGVAEPNGRLNVANLGDSGYVHIGLNAIRNHSSPQTHDFNAPFQLAKLPRKVLVQKALFNGMIKKYSETPEDADVTKHQLHNGDVLVFATDGLWDNLSPQEILNLVSREMTSSGAWIEGQAGSKVGRTLWDLAHKDLVDPDEIPLQARLAQVILNEAKAASIDPKRDGPFAKKVQKKYPRENWKGGKADDICVVVAVAMAEDS